MRRPAVQKKARDRSIVDDVIQSIVERVREGGLSAGQRLVEADFTARLGVSRGVVREAFQRLMADGLLEMERHRGVRVREVTARDFDNIFAVRTALEGLAAQLATPVLSKAPQLLIDCHERLREAVGAGDVHEFIMLNHEFHQIIVLAANNPVLSDACRRLGNTIHQVEAKTMIRRNVMLSSLGEHQRIVNAIVGGDAEKARAFAEEHQRSSAEQIRQLQQPRPTPVLARRGSRSRELGEQ